MKQNRLTAFVDWLSTWIFFARELSLHCILCEYFVSSIKIIKRSKGGPHLFYYLHTIQTSEDNDVLYKDRWPTTIKVYLRRNLIKRKWTAIRARPWEFVVLRAAYVAVGVPESGVLRHCYASNGNSYLFCCDNEPTATRDRRHWEHVSHIGVKINIVSGNIII